MQGGKSQRDKNSKRLEPERYKCKEVGDREIKMQRG